jgi:hypothetical protein
VLAPLPPASCQAVLWIDPLLAARDKAHDQLLEIRRLDGERQK